MQPAETSAGCAFFRTSKEYKMGSHRDLDYVTAVVDHLTAREGFDLEFFPDDYAAIFELEKQEIPLDFTLRSLSQNIREENGALEQKASIRRLSRVVSLEFADSLQCREH
jgi:hypothetical protein